MPDVYDAAIAYLEDDRVDQIYEAWVAGNKAMSSHPASCLFRYATNNGANNGNYGLGCLTQIRGSSIKHAETPELTEAIRADSRIPSIGIGIQSKHLPVFAEWQRRLDKELGRKPSTVLRSLRPYLDKLIAEGSSNLEEETVHA